MSMGHLYVLLGEVSVQFPCPFFLIGAFIFLVLNNMSSLYILEIKHLFKLSLANTFSHVGSSLFIVMMASLAMQMLVNWI